MDLEFHQQLDSDSVIGQGILAVATGAQPYLAGRISKNFCWDWLWPCRVIISNSGLGADAI